MKQWEGVKNILCIRPDNLGDVLMAEPAIRALKETYSAKITLLTSKSGAGIADFIDCIDDVMAEDLPWVKNESSKSSEDLLLIIEKIRKNKFDASVIFTNYSQNPAPSAELSFLAGIPKRLSYCRENIYDLLTNWAYDKEPFLGIEHSVLRNLRLVKKVNASTSDLRIKINYPFNDYKILSKLSSLDINVLKPLIVVHPWVRDDVKRTFSIDRLVSACRKLSFRFGFQIVVTGEEKHQKKTASFVKKVGPKAFDLSGKLSLVELINLINLAPLVLCSNTGVVHIASAVNTPVVVMYSRTNMEHTPWLVKNRVLLFDPEKEKRSMTPILRFTAPLKEISKPEDEDIVIAASDLLSENKMKKFNVNFI